CPRERRLTNHAVVAMIEEDIKQTRCTTCDAEHAYKGGKVPKRRKKETPAALYKEVLAGQLPSEEAHIVHELDDDTIEVAPSVEDVVDVVAADPVSNQPARLEDPESERGDPAAAAEP